MNANEIFMQIVEAICKCDDIAYSSYSTKEEAEKYYKAADCLRSLKDYIADNLI